MNVVISIALALLFGLFAYVAVRENIIKRKAKKEVDEQKVKLDKEKAKTETLRNKVEEANEKKESIETGNTTTDFNNSINLLHDIATGTASRSRDTDKN